MPEAILGLAFLTVVPAVLAVGIAFMLHVLKPHIPWKRRALIAGAAGGTIPILVPLVAVLTQGYLGSEILLVIIAMVILGLIAVAVVGFPAAYYATRPWEARSTTRDN